MKRTAVRGLALSLLLTNLFSTSVGAQTVLTDMVRDTLHMGGPAAAGVLSGTVDATGTVLDAGGHIIGTVPTGNVGVVEPGVTANRGVLNFGRPTVVYNYTLETRLSDLGNAIAALDQAGQLPVGRVQQMRGELEMIRANHAAAALSDGGITFDESLMLARQLDELNSRISGFSNAIATFQPLVSTDGSGRTRLFVTSRAAVLPGPGTVNTTTVLGMPAQVKPVAVGLPTASAAIANTAPIAIANAAPVAIANGAPVAVTSRVITSPATVVSGTPGAVVAASPSAVVSGAPAAVVAGTPAAVVTTTTGMAPGAVSVNLTGPVAVINSRRFELDRMIAEGVATGKIRPADATRLRAELQRVSTELATGRATPLTEARLSTLATTLDTLNTQITTAMGIPALAPVAVVQSGTTTVSTSGFGNVVPFQSVQPTVYSGLLTTRRSDLEHNIAAALAARAITAEQAAEFRGVIGNVATAEAALAGPNITTAQVLPLAYQLDMVGTRLHTLYPTYSAQPLVVGTRLVLPGSDVVTFDDIQLRRAQLEARIAWETRMGRLLPQEVAKLQEELAESVALEARYRADGFVDFGDSADVHRQFDRVARRLSEYLAGRRNAHTVSVR